MPRNPSYPKWPKKEKEALRSEHAQLQLHFQAAEKTTSAQRELRDTTIARLQGELEAAVREREAARSEWESTEAELEVGALSSALQKQEEENRRLLERLAALEHQQVVPVRKALEVAREDNRKLAQSLEQALLANSSLQSKLNRAQHDVDSKESQLQQLHNLREQEAEESKQETWMFTERLESLKKQFKSERETAKRAAHKELAEEIEAELKQMESIKEKYQKTNYEQGQMIQQFLSEMASLQQEMQSLVKGQQEATSLSRQHEAQLESERRLRLELQDRCQSLEEKARLLRHAKEAAEQRLSEASLESQQEIEAELKQMESIKEKYQKTNYEQGQMIQQFLSEMASLQQEMQSLVKGQQEATSLSRQHEAQLESERRLRLELQDRCQSLEEKARLLRHAKEAAEQRLSEASLESQQISANLEEAHQWFKTKFDSLQSEQVRGCPRSRSREEPVSSGNSSEGSERESAHAAKAKGDPGEPLLRHPIQPSPASLQRWETKQELKLLCRKYQTQTQGKK
ncbi:UNVERIFIED_CONTAM: hypothetical protein FKN15_056307 [Acipenser sinensis]